MRRFHVNQLLLVSELMSAAFTSAISYNQASVNCAKSHGFFQ